MHPHALKRMKEIAITVLGTLEVSPQKYLMMPDYETFTPLMKFIGKAYSRWVDVDFLYPFLSINKVLHSAGLLETPGTLGKTTDHARIVAAADELISFWEGLPYTYEFLFPLPSLDPNQGPSQISDGVSFKTCPGTDAGVSQPPEAVPLGGLMSLAAALQAPQPPVRCLAIEVKGVVLSALNIGIAGATAVRKAKITIQLGLALGAFSSGWSERIRDVKHAGIKTLHGPPTDFNQVPLRVSFAEDLPQVYAAVPRVEGELLPTLGEWLSDAGIVLKNYERWDAEKDQAKNEAEVTRGHFDQHCARIATAAEWLFDARSETPSPTTFVQTAIALEALYGGTETEPVIETLTNRIAYTLGRAPQERHEFSRQFRKFYQTRSKVVHSGASRLSGEERFQLIHAQSVLNRALVHELELVSRGARAFTDAGSS